MHYYTYIAFIAGIRPPRKTLSRVENSTKINNHAATEAHAKLAKPLAAARDAPLKLNHQPLSTDKKMGRPPKGIDTQLLADLVASGQCYKQIAARFGISTKTIQRALKNKN